MKMNEIMAMLKKLAISSNFYKKVYDGLCMYKECDMYSYNYFSNDLESQNFMNVTELKQYLEAICSDD